MTDAIEAILARCSGYATLDEYVLECGDDAYRDALTRAAYSSRSGVQAAAAELLKARAAFNGWLFDDPYIKASQRDLVLEDVQPREHFVLGALNGLARAQVDTATALRALTECRDVYARMMAAGIPSLDDVERLDAILGFGKPRMCPVCRERMVQPGKDHCGSAECEPDPGLAEPVVGKPWKPT
jgi:hypothetical protein